MRTYFEMDCEEEGWLSLTLEIDGEDRLRAWSWDAGTPTIEPAWGEASLEDVCEFVLRARAALGHHHRAVPGLPVGDGSGSGYTYGSDGIFWVRQASGPSERGGLQLLRRSPNEREIVVVMEFCADAGSYLLRPGDGLVPFEVFACFVEWCRDNSRA